MKNFLRKSRQMILYMSFGILTLIVNILTYYIMSKVNDNTAVDTAVALFASIVVAYVTNRKFVFESQQSEARAIALEFFSFFSCRLLSGLGDIIIMVVFVDFFHYNDMVVKLWSNAFVIIFNYVASKWLIFRNK